MLSQRAQEAKEAVQRALTETLGALERAQTDEEVAYVVGIVESFSTLEIGRRLRPLHGVEATLRQSTARLERISRPGTPK